MSLLKIVRPAETSPRSEIEVVSLTHAQLEYVASLSREMNPEIPMDFGGAHAIRALLERCEEAGIDADAVLRLTTG